MSASRITEKFGYGFIPPEYLPEGKDEYYLRNEQSKGSLNRFRHLTPDEIDILTKNRNSSGDWNDVLVTDPFEAEWIKNSEFFGLVRIGKLETIVLERLGLKLPAGITYSRVISCDIGDHAAVHNVRYLSHYIIGDQCVLSSIDEMFTTPVSKFGNGFLKEGEDKSALISIELMNEAGGRSVQAFEGMLPADACLWAKFRGDEALMNKLKNITPFDARRGHYGTVGENSVIKNCRVIKDAKFGPYSEISGANLLEDLTVCSSVEETTRIGEGVELSHGIAGRGCLISHNSIADRFVLCGQASLKYGARLFHSVLGENSTISCCEVLNNLIFPSHEQHHNNSFLIASLIMGQSNIAAGATIGSNHNSRSNDGEIQAGRGFWPGLCATLKHSSKFASFTLIQKGNYPSELNIPLPFSLVSNNESENRLEVMPAYWWMYNMYALARNSSKFQNRDRRIRKEQNIEFEALAPDTAEEIIHAMNLLEIWTEKAASKKSSTYIGELAASGKKLLLSPGNSELEIVGENMENSRRKVVILKPGKAYQAYRQMLHYYAVKNCMSYLEEHPSSTFEKMQEELKAPRKTEWMNLGGQLMPANQFDLMVSDIKSSCLTSWDEIHSAYNRLWNLYPLEKQRHALSVLLELYDVPGLTKDLWNQALDEALKIQFFVRDAVFQSRNKDFENPFRKTTFRDEEEMKAVSGVVGDNGFIRQINRETEIFQDRIESIRERG